MRDYSIRDGLRPAGILLAVALALAAQSLLTGKPVAIQVPSTWPPSLRYDFAGGLLLAAMACFAVAMYKSHSPEEDGLTHSAVAAPA
jgi:hypothetical protein